MLSFRIEKRTFTELSENQKLFPPFYNLSTHKHKFSKCRSRWILKYSIFRLQYSEHFYSISHANHSILLTLGKSHIWRRYSWKIAIVTQFHKGTARNVTEFNYLFVPVTINEIYFLERITRDALSLTVSIHISFLGLFLVFPRFSVYIISVTN